MKRNILTSDPAVPTSRYTSVLDFSDLYIAFSRTPGKFYFDGKDTFLISIFWLANCKQQAVKQRA